jgi:hypothetical protein
MHQALVREANEGAKGPMFVQGLPHVNAAGTAIQFHFGVDRMLQEPFSRRNQRLLALRPLCEGRDVFRLETTEGMPFALPAGSTWFFLDSNGPGSMALGQPPAGPGPQELKVTGDADGVLDVTSARLDDLLSEFEGKRKFQVLWERDEPSFGLQTRAFAAGVSHHGVHRDRLSVLFCADHAAAGSPDGAIDMLRFLAGHPQRGLEPARFGLGAFAFVGNQLLVPTRSTSCPSSQCWSKPARGRVSGSPPHTAQTRLVTFRFDRHYPAGCAGSKAASEGQPQSQQGNTG